MRCFPLAMSPHRGHGRRGWRRYSAANTRPSRNKDLWGRNLSRRPEADHGSPGGAPITIEDAIDEKDRNDEKARVEHRYRDDPETAASPHNTTSRRTSQMRTASTAKDIVRAHGLCAARTVHRKATLRDPRLPFQENRCRQDKGSVHVNAPMDTTRRFYEQNSLQGEAPKQSRTERRGPGRSNAQGLARSDRP